MDALEIIAHRGSSFIAPENTLASVRLAWAERADSVEGDFRLTRDGIIVALHDESLRRTTGVDRAVWECNLSELKAVDAGSWKGPQYSGEPIPTLVELLETVPQGKRFYVEVKCGLEIVLELKRLAERNLICKEQIIFICLDIHVIAAIKRGLPEFEAYWVVDFKRQNSNIYEPTVGEMLRLAQSHELDGLDLSAKGPLDSLMIEKIRGESLGLCVWTVDNPDDAKRLMNLGVRRITTNRPGWLREQLTRLSV